MKKLVVLTGAGISAESGLPTFRTGQDSLWENYNVEDVATATAWRKNPALVLEFYNKRRADALNAEPNLAHKTLFELEEFFDVHIITTNVDDLHERAGSTKVLHLHGELTKMRSVYNTRRLYECTEDIKLGDVADDEGQLRPHIVWFEEDVPMMYNANEIANNADIFVIVGTSLQVYPAANLVNFVRDDVPKYIVDPNPAGLLRVENLTKIAKKATEGVTEIKELLINNK